MKKKDEIKKEYLEIGIEMMKFKDQLKFIKHLSELIDNHYEKAFKNYSFIKEEEICKQIKLNSPVQMDNKLIKELKNQKQALLESQEGNHYNILVLGRTGVGKSTLINVVLDLKGENAAKENAVKPETGANYILPNFNNNEIIEIGKKNKFNPIEYTSKKSSLVLLDSRGIEISKNYNIDIAAEDIIEFINKRNGLNSDPDKFIHCVWYLVSGNRFEDDEGKYVQSLKSLYTNFGLPIIFVYSQAINEEDGNLIKERIEELMKETINFKQIIARDIEIKTQNKKRKPMIAEAFGVFEEDGLIKMSFEYAKNALKSYEDIPVNQGFYNQNLLRAKKLYLTEYDRIKQQINKRREDYEFQKVLSNYYNDFNKLSKKHPYLNKCEKYDDPKDQNEIDFNQYEIKKKNINALFFKYDNKEDELNFDITDELIESMNDGDNKTLLNCFEIKEDYKRRLALNKMNNINDISNDNLLSEQKNENFSIISEQNKNKMENKKNK